ncbi:MAG: ABC transporter permease [Sporolactobacillus sp.]
MKTFNQFFKYRETIVGIVIAFVFMLVFFCIWMTGYHGVTNRTNQLKIGLVNNDNKLGNIVTDDLKKNLPFKVKTYQKVKTAKNDMSQRNLDMVINIPQQFTQDLQQDKQIQIDYLINQANASLAKQIMTNAATNITQNINGAVYHYKQRILITQLSNHIGHTDFSKKLAQNISNNLSQSLKSLNLNTVTSNIVQKNRAEDFSVTMVPLLVVLASFVGSMIMSLNLNSVSIKLNDSFNKWSLFLSKQMINIGMSIFLALITMILMKIFGIRFQTSLLETWLFQILVYFSFLSFTQMFIILFGPAGMLFNILSLSIQLVTSGVIVPKTMLAHFYQSLSGYFPASHVADGYFTVLFGGQGLTNNILLLLLISCVTLFITVIKVTFQKKQIPSTNNIGRNKVQS